MVLHSFEQGRSHQEERLSVKLPTKKKRKNVVKKKRGVKVAAKKRREDAKWDRGVRLHGKKDISAELVRGMTRRFRGGKQNSRSIRPHRRKEPHLGNRRTQAENERHRFRGGEIRPLGGKEGEAPIPQKLG